MPSRDTIIAIIEPDVHPQQLTERAALLAEFLGCDLELLLCDADVGPLDEKWISNIAASEIRSKIVAAQTEIIEELAANVRNKDVTISTDVLLDRPVADAILQRVDEVQPRLLVKGTQYHSAAERSIFLHTDWLLIRSCPCPLYLAKPQAFSDSPMIVAAVDPMHSHDKPAALDYTIIEFAKGLASKSNGEVHLVHTYRSLTGVGSAATRTFKAIQLPVSEIAKKMQVEHREKLDELASETNIESGNVHQLPGRARDLIPMFARTHGADLVVMGGLARWGMKRAVIGSTAERVIDHLPCDVLIVRTDDHWIEGNNA